MAVDGITTRAQDRTPELARAARFVGGGTAGNELLTATAGAVLIVLLAIVGVTILRVRQLLSVHMFVGMLLIGPLALKLASTGYRFARYYARNARYRLQGAPAPPLRAIAPIVVASTIVVFASGVALLFAGPSSRDALLPIHKVSFIVWLLFTAPHVLAHLPKLVPALQADYGRTERWGGAPGRSGRVLSLAAALAGGLVLALLVLPEFGAWLHTGVLHERG